MCICVCCGHSEWTLVVYKPSGSMYQGIKNINVMPNWMTQIPWHNHILIYSLTHLLLYIGICRIFFEWMNIEGKLENSITNIKKQNDMQHTVTKTSNENWILCAVVWKWTHHFCLSSKFHRCDWLKNFTLILKIVKHKITVYRLC